MSNPKAFEPVKVGVIGLGRFGRLHSLSLSALAEAELVGVVARRQESIDKLRRELPEVRGWVNLDQAIAESGAEAWVVACSTPNHVAVTRSLLQAGCHVLLEKPISESLAEAESLSPLIRPDSANCMIGHILLFNSEFRGLREEAAKRNGISHIDCARHRPASIVRDFPGENPLQATMVHDLYCIQVLMNGADPIRFSGQFHRTNDGAVDLAMAQLQFPNGTWASCVSSYMTPAGMAPRGYDRMEVFGPGWSARICPNPRPIEVYDERAIWPMPLEIRTDPHGPTGMMAEELRCFCRVVRGRQPVPAGATYHDAIKVQRWLDQIEQAALA
ncbi:MAG: Gfo/Idh/MocA family protein [Planctomycetaceae bacterium]